MPACDDGFTLVELLVASAASLVVTGALVTLLASVVHNQPEAQERSAQIQNGRYLVERMVREVRQGAVVTGTNSTTRSLTIKTYTRGGCNGAAPTTTAILCQVNYTCAAASSGLGYCTRKAGTATATTIVVGLASPDVFSYAPVGTSTATCSPSTTTSPALVCLKLVFPARGGDDTITLQDGAFLRNLT